MEPLILFVGTILLGVSFIFGYYLSRENPRLYGLELLLAILFFIVGGVWVSLFVPAGKEQMLFISFWNQLISCSFLLGTFAVTKAQSIEYFRATMEAMIIGVFVVFLSWLWVGFLETQGLFHKEQQLVTLLQEEHFRYRWLLFGFVAFLAPISEELLFRAKLLPLLATKIGWGGGIWATGLFFGLIHWDSWSSIPILVVFGVLLGWLRYKYRSVIPSIIAHMTNNMIVVIELLFMI